MGEVASVIKAAQNLYATQCICIQLALSVASLISKRPKSNYPMMTVNMMSR